MNATMEKVSTKRYSVLVNSKDFARENLTGEFVDYVNLFEGEFDSLEEAKTFALDLLSKARAEDPDSDCYLGGFIDSVEKREDGQPAELWAIDECEDGTWNVWLAGEGR